jgi:hypothetical protein
MTILLILVAWTFIISLVAGLCMAARVGDVESLPWASAEASEQGMQPLVWKQADDLEISARVNAARVRPDEVGVAALRSDGIAA